MKFCSEQETIPKPKVLRWALERDRKDPEWLRDKYPKFGNLLDDDAAAPQPSMAEIEKFAKLVHVPLGFLLLTEPPKEELPCTDFRSIKSATVKTSADLWETIYLCRERQDWYRDYARAQGWPELQFVGSTTTADEVAVVAQLMRQELKFEVDKGTRDSNKLLNNLISRAEEIGVLVMINDRVKNNPYRRLDVSEFRGFALADPHAPLIFVNGADAKDAQVFTLVHELAHIWLDNSALSDQKKLIAGEEREPQETWCNKVAAEFLVPQADLEQYLESISEGARTSSALLSLLPKHYRVSKQVILLRLRDLGRIATKEFQEHWRRLEVEQENYKKKKKLEAKQNTKAKKSFPDPYPVLTA